MSTNREDMHGKVAVITGAGSGIGAALATYAATELVMTVAVVDVVEARAQEVSDSINATGGRALAFARDVTDYGQVEELATTLAETHGSPALVVANAGVELAGPIWEITPSAWARVQDVNLNGTFHTVRAFLPEMMASQERSHVLVTSSIAGLGAGDNQSAYATSKHAARVLAQTLIADLRTTKAKVGVSVLFPGIVKTNIFIDADATASGADVRDYFAEFVANGMSPAELARLTFEQLLEGARWIHPEPSLSLRMLEPMVKDLMRGLE